MSHPTDAAGQRDLKEEANTIKQSFTNSHEPVPTTSKVHISFTSLAQAKIPNFSASKILGTNLKVTYVPDFYYVVDLAQKMFMLAKQDKTLKRIDTISMYSFTLYILYASMYVFLDTVHQTNPNFMDLTQVLNTFRQNGYQTLEFPVVFSQWITAIGKHLDVETKRLFVPYLPPIQEQGNYFLNYFYSPDTAHLLPNFRLAHITILLSAKNSPITIPNANRSLDQRLGNPLAAITAVAHSSIARSKSYLVPGIPNLLQQYEDDQLLPILLANVQHSAWPDSLHRYLMLNPQLLTHLKYAVEPLFQHIDKIVISNVSPIGTSLVMTPLFHSQNQDEQIPGKKIAADPANPNTQVIYDGLPSFTARVRTKFEIVNGNVDYATLTPVVRIANQATAVIIDDYQFVDPQHKWFSTDVEFQTPEFSLSESRSYFKRND